MSNLTRSSSFPETQQDISRLRQTATDAASDLTSTAAIHGSKAKGELTDFVGHIREEGGRGLGQLTERFNGLVSSARNYAAERPLICVGTAFALGFLVGLSRRRFRD